MDATLAPFSCTYTPAVAELLAQLGCSLAVSTFQAGKVLLVSAEGDQLTQLPRAFEAPAGLAYTESRLAVACKHEITLLANDPRLGWAYPRKPNHYDGFFVPRTSHYCGQLNIHDIDFTSSGGLVGVNTLFSCLFRLDAAYSFVPTWKPPFISALAPEDRCHLNGLALVDGAPRYVTALGTTDEAGGWRPDKVHGGVLMDVATNEVVLSELPVPHSPRMWDGELYLLLSAAGELVRVDVTAGAYDVVARVPAFVRGLSRLGDYAFVGCSRLRSTHTFSDLRIAKEGKDFCGVVVIHLPTGAIVGEIRYVNTCEEIYDVQVLPGLRRPGILGTQSSVHHRGLSLPDSTFWADLD